MHRLNLVTVLIVMIVFPGCAHQAGRNGQREVWTQSGFTSFDHGRFGDGGANTYVSADGRIQLVNRWDLNNDGYIDLVFANSHPHVERLDAAIYWGNGKDFDDSRKTPVANEGAQRTVAADLDDDGQMDAVFPSYTNGTWSKMDSAVYYGGGGDARAEGAGASAWSMPPFERKVTLPTEAAQAAAVGDLNRDGYPDLVFAQSAGFWEYRGGDALASPSRVFWGSADGYQRENFLDLEAAGAAAVAIADLNGDGWPEVILANRERDGKFNIGSYIYWGAATSFSSERRTELPTNQGNGVAVSDVNGDGAPDVLFANGQGPVSYIYLNDVGSFSAERRLELPTSDARDCAAADLNGDGAADVFFTNHQTAGNFATHSYLYWGDQSGGFSADRRQSFETLGAWGLSLADLNGDARPEIVVSNYREGVLHDVPSYIYWNDQGKFSDTLRTSLFTRGAVGNTVADFDGDGKVDVLFNNTVGRSRGGLGPLYVYWGDANGQYRTQRRAELPSVEPYEWAAGDLNDDGWPELIVANQAETGRKITENFIYWGGPDGLSETRRSALVAHGCRGVSIADLDGDGRLDVMLFNSAPADPGAYIYWGEGGGRFNTAGRTELPGTTSGVPTLADLNGDGHLDLVTHPGGKANAAIFWGDGTRKYGPERRTEVPDTSGVASSEAADMNRDGLLDLILTRRGYAPSYVYYGNAKGEFSSDRRSSFTPIETQGVTVGDLDADGWLDIVAPTYKHQGSRATLTRVFLGGPGGVSDERFIELPTHSGTGSQIADYNRDGHPDLLLICHRGEGDPNRTGSPSDHVTDSYLYWGGPDGFRADRRLLIPARGPHYDSGVDLGNIYDRTLRFDYISPPHAFSGRGDGIEWEAKTPFGSAVEFQIRTASSREGLAEAEWVGPRGEDSYFRKSGSRLTTPPGHGWIQYRAVLISSNGAGSPVLERVSIGFRNTDAPKPAAAAR